MPRRKRASLRRDANPDFKYADKLVGKLITRLMLCGKKSVAEGVVYTAFDRIAAVKKDDPVKVFRQALENIKPILEVRSRRVGGANYQVPMEVRPERRVSLGLRWLVTAARDRSEKGMEGKLASEVLEALENRGGAVKKREETHRMAEANKAFAHFRW
ncbi:MAG: 30S ribosomal protein S7 [Deltaproteobacteria bacterium]|nr:30S ribosomal protein S7 [Deltaproteobacteria bacterium]